VLRVEAEERSRELDDERAEVERLRRVDNAKSEFVAVAAHEFRTPLAAVIGVLSTLREHGSVLTPEDRIELLDGATSQANRLARLVDDLLTVSRIEDGILRLSLETAQPRHLLSEAAQVSGMAGRLVIRIGRVEAVRCDPDAIIRVLTNLMDNARKYAPADSKVHIDVALEGDLVRFNVADEGPGIPDEDRAEIFERFRRLEGGKTKPGAGSACTSAAGSSRRTEARSARSALPAVGRRCRSRSRAPRRRTRCRMPSRATVMPTAWSRSSTWRWRSTSRSFRPPP
jgi:signal transduction histidine kinase